MPELDFAHLDDENDPATCRGRAAHARMAAQETTDQDFKRIFQRLAELYEAKANNFEVVERPPELFHPDDASAPKPRVAPRDL